MNPKYLPSEVVARLRAGDPANPRSLFARLLVETGARISEALAVRVADLDVEGRTIRIETLKRRGEVWRSVGPIPSPTWDGLALLSRGLPPEARIFPWSRQWAYRVVREEFLRAGASPSLAHPHAARHSFAITMIRAGVPVPIVQDLLGHADLSTTTVYTRFADAERERHFAAAWASA